MKRIFQSSTSLFERVWWNSKFPSLKVAVPVLKRDLFIQTETTPNEDSLMFKPGCRIMEGGHILEFLEPNAARRSSDLADELFQIEGVKGIMFGGDFITITKAKDYSWVHIKPAVFAAIMDYLSLGKPLVKQPPNKEEGTTDSNSNGELGGGEKYELKDYETVMMIKEILDTRIRPTVQDDGGDVQFMSFKDGIVELQLRGACRSCSSSTITLKHGIENMLMHYIPEVKEVCQVEDPLEKVSEEYFTKLESLKNPPPTK